MRFLFIICLLALAAPAYGQDAEAEKLFRAMEEKVKAAKSLKVVINLWNRGPSDVSNVSITVQIADGNKARIEVKGFLDRCLNKPGGEQFDMLLVSDGKQTVVQRKPGGVAAHYKTAVGQNDYIAKMLSRTGFLQYDCLFRADQRFDVKQLVVSGFKLGDKLQGNDHNSQMILFSLGENQVLSQQYMKVAIDSKTLLPSWPGPPIDVATLREKVSYATGPHASYSEFVLNPKLDQKLFELPK